MRYFSKLWQNRSQYSKIISYIFIACAVIFLITNFSLIYLELNAQYIDPVNIIGLTLLILVACLFLGIFLVNDRITNIFTFIKEGRNSASKLRKRIIIAFSLGTTVPTVIVAIFSTYFFNFGVQAWFDDKVSRVLEQSIIVGESYIEEHILQLKDTAISISDDLGEVYTNLIQNPELFQEFLAAQAEVRTLDEAILFRKSTNSVLAQTSLSFSLSFLTIPAYLFEKANKGEVVQISSDLNKIRILIKLRDYSDTYLLIGRLIDDNIIDHINKTNGAAQEYFRLKSHIGHLQIKFSLIFILLSIILLLSAIIWGRNFAHRIVKPIRDLVIAAEKVKNGDLTAQVPEEGLKKDEIKILSSAFNRMVKQIDRQRRDLLIAQRALAWSDVARKVAHEIKNPLTPIQLSAERLLKKFRAEVNDITTFEKYVSNIIRHSNDIKMIVSGFVSFARLPTPEFHNREIISMLRQLVNARALINDNITYKFSSNINKFELVCDADQINRVIVNLLQNSEDAFDENIITKEILIQAENNKDFFSVTIKDTGPGFDKFVLTSAKTEYFTTKAKGMGLGLSIVDRIMCDHEGHLDINNHPNGGALVKLTFNAKELKNKLK